MQNININFHNRVEEAIDNYCIEMVTGLIELFNFDISKALSVIENEYWFNYYEDVRLGGSTDWAALAGSILGDIEGIDGFADGFTEADVDNLTNLEDAELEQFLKDSGWRIASNGFAIGFDDKALALLINQE
ncbi:hypothetical protein [Alkaliphilus sp. B6464]|uniref:hypothetical protein n=1 Tax=Alkaliphilus sp. B6464 TaxID=2731219 RepID=UPI001BA89DEF|nr:hypothetical protein [Alkaliphilus sp. B6464]QUH21883.1 hypothetical protein HYG84_18275 [Alkaliphilus sp. B6464]